jgi:uncharacterized protein involved in outer membrane biogenesis
MMNKILKILAGIIVLLIVAMSIFIATFDVNQYKGEIIKMVEEQTGRDFDVTGDLSLGVSLIPTIKVEGVKLGNTTWGSAPEMITVKSFEMQAGLIPLLSGNLKISQLTLDTAEILLETSKDGTGNWEFKPAAEKAAPEKTEKKEAAKIDINEINIKNSGLTYKDGKTGEIKSVKIENLIVEGSAFSQSLKIVLAAVYNGIPVSVDGSIGSLASLADNEKFPVDVTAKVDDAIAKIKGVVDKPKTFEGADIQLDFKANSLKPFSVLSGKELPDIGAVALTGRITESKGIYSLESVNVQALEAQLAVDGKVSAAKPQDEFDLDIKVDAKSLAGFNKLKDIIKMEFPDMGPLALTGHVVGKDGFYQLDAVNASLARDSVLLNGKLSIQTPLQEFDLDIRLNAENVAKYNALTGQSLPDKGPLLISGHVSEKDGVYLFKALNAELPNTKLNVDGKLTNLKQTDGSNLNISFQSTSLADLNAFTGGNLPALGPVSLLANVTDQQGIYHLKDMKFTMDKTDLSGDMAINIKGDRPAVNATLTSNMLDLTPFQSEKEKVKKSKVFSSDPLPLDGLKAADVKLDLKAKKVNTIDMVMDNVNLVMNLNNGKLAITPLNAGIGSGSLELQMNLDGSNGKSAIVDTSINIKNLEPSSLDALKDEISGARTDVTLNGKGSGNSVAAIMAGWNGKLLIKSGKGTIKSKAGKVADADILASTFNLFNPGAKGSDTQLECGVIKFDIKDGIATTDKGIAFVTSNMNIVGSGVVNLKTEQLDIGIDPQARSGSGISAGQLAELVRIGGTLAEPKAVPDTKAAFKTAASVGAAVATGGLSILAQSLYDRSTADTDPCATALGIKPAATTTTTKTEEEQPKSVTEKATDTVKDAGSAIKDTFKGLFGK